MFKHVYNILNKYKVIKCNFNLQKMEIFKKRAALRKLPTPWINHQSRMTGASFPDSILVKVLNEHVAKTVYKKAFTL